MIGTIAKDQLRLLNRVTLIPILLLCLLAVTLTTFQHYVSEIDHLIEETDSTIKEVRKTQQLLLVMESNYNSYVVTRRQEFLKNYLIARNDLPEAFSGLERQARDRGAKIQFEGLRKAFKDWVLHSESLFGLTFSEGVKIFETTKFQRIGNMYLTSLRNAFEEFTNRQINLRNKQLERSNKTRMTLLSAGLILLLFTAVFLAWYFRKQLKAAFEKYELQNLVLDQSREALKESLEVKEKALKSRDEFITIASHELNTPLQGLLLQAQMVRRSLSRPGEMHITEEKLERYLDREISQVNRLTQLVSDMLEITKMGTGMLKMKQDYIELNAAIEDTLEDLQHLIQTSGSRIFLENNGNLEGRWDPLRLKQILLNLLTNALKYGQGEPITVRTYEKDGKGRIEIEDRGLGIESISQERIFNRFERDISSSEVSGLGLGLFITKELVKAHGGLIWVESTGKDQGSTFIVELPLERREFRHSFERPTPSLMSEIASI
jgi:signal transduction histidine kinase